MEDIVKEQMEVEKYLKRLKEEEGVKRKESKSRKLIEKETMKRFENKKKKIEEKKKRMKLRKEENLKIKNRKI